MNCCAACLVVGVVLGCSVARAEEPRYTAELVFPLQPQHNHAPGIVECPNGDLLMSWYRGSGERGADDVAVYGARKRQDAREWSAAFLMADHPGFPDCNTCMMLDRQQRLWLFWPVILDNHWESSLTCCKVASEYTADGPPRWQREQVLFLKPADFSRELLAQVQEEAKTPGWQTSDRKRHLQEITERAAVPLYQRLGWMPRTKPTVLPSGRILLPLYTDTFSISMMAISDDQGQTWYAGKPLIGVGGLQPTVLRRDDGTLVAYLREKVKKRIRVSESKDDGLTWGPVGGTELPNPGAGIDGVRLANGRWALVYNDTVENRNSLAISLSDDEGHSWKWTRHLENFPSGHRGDYHYPAVIQGGDGTIHVAYSYFVERPAQDGKPPVWYKSMKHAALNEAWIQAGDQP